MNDPSTPALAHLDVNSRERRRIRTFEQVWRDDLDAIFEDVAGYYDRANVFASLGQWHRWRQRFLAMTDPQPGQRALDVCAGTNAIGIALLEREPQLEVHAMDRSTAMQRVGGERARARGFDIHSHIGDVHRLPFPDDHFDMVTLQWASRHLRVTEVFAEIQRVLKPGGCFYHCDMLRPANRFIEAAYYYYLKFCLALAAKLYKSGPAALGSRTYFIRIIELFYSSEELAFLLRQAGFDRIHHKDVLGGMVAFHQARKPGAT